MADNQNENSTPAEASNAPAPEAKAETAPASEARLEAPAPHLKHRHLHQQPTQHPLMTQVITGVVVMGWRGDVDVDVDVDRGKHLRNQ